MGFKLLFIFFQQKTQQEPDTFIHPIVCLYPTDLSLSVLLGQSQGQSTQELVDGQMSHWGEIIREHNSHNHQDVE